MNPVIRSETRGQPTPFGHAGDIFDSQPETRRGEYVAFSNEEEPAIVLATRKVPTPHKTFD